MKSFYVVGIISLFIILVYLVVAATTALIYEHDVEKRGNQIIKCELIQKDTRKQIIYENKKYDLYDSVTLSKIVSLAISYDSLKRVCDAKDILINKRN